MAANYSKVDDIVLEYLQWRGYRESITHLNAERRNLPNSNSNNNSNKASLPLGHEQQRNIINRIMASADDGDYPTSLTLWDTYVVQSLHTKSININNDARTAEFILNLSIAIYPFRPEVIKTARTPKIASQAAARSMTIFKHFIESRGVSLTQKDAEFAAYRNLSSIAFPPTHPLYKHLFSIDWQRTARYRLVSFLERFFSTSDTPILCDMYNKWYQSPSTINQDNNVDKITLAFKKRERNFYNFSKSLYDMTNELVSLIENRRNLDKDFISNFRHKFNTLKDVLTSTESKLDDTAFESSIDSSKHSSNNGNYGTLSTVSTTTPSTSKAVVSKVDKIELFIQVKMQSRKTTQVVAKLLNHRITKSPSAGMSFDLEPLLNEFLQSCCYTTVLIDDMINTERESCEADLKNCWTGALNSCVFIKEVVGLLYPSNKESQSKNSRNAIITSIVRMDVLGIGSGFTTSTGKLRKQTTPSIVINFLNAAALLFQRLSGSSSSSIIGDGSNLVNSMVINSTDAANPTPTPMQSNDIDYLIATSELLIEYVSRLIVSLGNYTESMNYLQSNGLPLATAMSNTVHHMIVVQQQQQAMINLSELKADDLFKRRHHTSMFACMSLITLVAMSKQNQLSIIKNNIIATATTIINHILHDVYDGAHGNFYLSMVLSLVLVTIQSLESQRALVASTKKMKEMEEFLKIVCTVMSSVTNSSDHSDDAKQTGYVLVDAGHAHLIMEILIKLFGEIVTRQIAREIPSVEAMISTLTHDKYNDISNEIKSLLLNKLNSDDIEQVSNSTNVNAITVNFDEIFHHMWSVFWVFEENEAINQFISSYYKGNGIGSSSSHTISSTSNNRSSSSSSSSNGAANNVIYSPIDQAIKQRYQDNEYDYMTPLATVGDDDRIGNSKRSIPGNGSPVATRARATHESDDDNGDSNFNIEEEVEDGDGDGNGDGEANNLYDNEEGDEDDGNAS